MHNNFSSSTSFLLYNVNFIINHTALLQEAMEKLLAFTVIIFSHIHNGT